MEKALIGILTVAMIKKYPGALERTAASVREQMASSPPGSLKWYIKNGEKPSSESAAIFAANADIIAWAESAPDDGIYPAMNELKARSAGEVEYESYMNAGDVYFARDTLAKCGRVLREFPETDYLFGDCKIRDSIFKAPGINCKTKVMPGCHQATLFKANAALAYDPKLSIVADWKFSVQHAEAAKAPVYIPEPLCDNEGGGVSEREFWEVTRQLWQARKDLGIDFVTNLQTLGERIPARRVFTGAVSLVKQVLPADIYDKGRDAYRKLAGHATPENL